MAAWGKPEYACAGGLADCARGIRRQCRNVCGLGLTQGRGACADRNELHAARRSREGRLAEPLATLRSHPESRGVKQGDSGGAKCRRPDARRLSRAEGAMKALVVVLTLLAALLGAGGGLVVGFIATVIDRVHTDTQLGCALLQTAESAGYLTKERRGQLVDKVVPALSKGAPPRPGGDFVRAFADGWWDSIREDQKSGCSGS